MGGGVWVDTEVKGADEAIGVGAGVEVGAGGRAGPKLGVGVGTGPGGGLWADEVVSR